MKYGFNINGYKMSNNWNPGKPQINEKGFEILIQTGLEINEKRTGFIQQFTELRVYIYKILF